MDNYAAAKAKLFASEPKYFPWNANW
jgi:hypothetical protein